MARPVIVLRPEPGCSETLSEALARGLDAFASPLFDIEPLAWEVPDPGMFDGVLAGSANAFRHGGPGLACLRALPVYAVGEHTAAAARNAGFSVAAVGEKGLQALLDAISVQGRLLRLAGETRVSLSPPAGLTLTERAVYRTSPRTLSAPVVERMKEGAVVLLHSAEASRFFAAECDRMAIDRGRIALAALAPRIAEAAGDGWRAVRAPAQVADSALLALAEDMCQ